MTYLRNVLHLSSRDLVVAHGSSADAVLRYIETDDVKAVVLIDGSDVYTAGERHGRCYHYQQMREHCRDVTVGATTSQTASELDTLRDGLAIPYTRTARILSESAIPLEETRQLWSDRLISLVKLAYDRQI